MAFRCKRDEATRWRRYATEGTDTWHSRGIFLVYVAIEAKDAKEFNDWYTTEHLPE